MAQIDHDTYAVHLGDDLFPKLAQPSMRARSIVARISDQIVCAVGAGYCTEKFLLTLSK